MANTIKIKRGLSTNLNNANLQDGEIAFTTDTKKLYISGTEEPINNNTTYSISKSGSTITLKGSDGSTSTVSDSNTTYTAATTSKNGLMSTTDKTKLDGIATGAEVNQNAFSNVVIGSTTIAADAKTDTLTVVAGSNITLTPDATNDKITIAATDTTYGNATTSAAGLMTAAMVTKLNGIATGANKTTVDTSLSSSSTNPVQNKVIYNALAGKAATSAIPTALSQLTNDSDFVTSLEIAENYATKEYVNNMTADAGLKYKVVDSLPTNSSGETISILDASGKDLSGAKLLLDIGSSYALSQANGVENIVECTNGFIKVVEISSLARIAASDLDLVLCVQDSQQNITKLYCNAESINLTEYVLPSDFGTVVNISYNGVLELIQVELAGESPEEGVIYLVSKEDSSNDIYDEYMWISNQWELIGSTAVDLSQYYTKTEIDNKTNIINQDITTLTSDINILNSWVNTQFDPDVRNIIDEEVTQDIDNLTTTVNNLSNQITSGSKYIYEDGNGDLVIAKEGNLGRFVAHSDRTSLYLGEAEIAYVKDGKLYSNTIKTNSLQIGSWLYELTETGTLNEKWIGDE